MTLDKTTALPITDPRLADLNIFGPPIIHEPFTYTSSFKYHSRHIATPTKSTPKSSAISPAQQSSVKSPQKFYCASCKKSFASEATYTSHLSSSKHLANVKEKSPVKKGTAAASWKKGEAETPEVADALKKLKQADKAAQANGASMAPVYWNLAKLLYGYGRVQDTSRALWSLLQVLRKIKPNDEGNSLSASQLSVTTYLARLALARLYLPLFPDASKDLYMLALEERWNLKIPKLKELAKKIKGLSLNELLQVCDEIRDTSGIQSRSSSKRSDPNLIAHIAFCEVGCAFAQCYDGQEEEDFWNDPAKKRATGSDKFGLIVLGIAAMCCRNEELIDHYTQILYRISKIYSVLGMEWCSSDCFFQVASDLPMENTERWWWIAKAILCSLVMGDFIRIQEMEKKIAERRGSEEIHDVIDILFRIARAVKTHDFLYLRCRAEHDMEYLTLLVDQLSPPTWARGDDVLKRTWMRARESIIARTRKF
ncbi:uncharacterized protein VTP21DRAFT_6801 [Calcarisporiella thermophila]|uniref:uncharacterized protein n=1 Tax=Calcarisporiella thermophila TaxID=911321 RepID=UPI0037427DC3